MVLIGFFYRITVTDQLCSLKKMQFFLTVESCMECSSACPWGAHCKKRLSELNTLYTLIDAECAPCILVYTQIELPRKQHDPFFF